MKKIFLADGNNAIVDDFDYEYLSKLRWYSFKRVRKNSTKIIPFNVTKVNKKTVNIYMHKLITGKIKSGYVVDHINGDTLDNRRSNLRICTNKENVRNRGVKIHGSSKYKGVCWDKSRKKWIACITVDYKQINLGRFESEKEAAKEYDKAALKYFKEFANINF